jgi:hypothetical protein
VDSICRGQGDRYLVPLVFGKRVITANEMKDKGAVFLIKIYPLEIKLAAVNDYLDGGDSIRKIANKYSVGKTMFHSDYSH